MPSGELLSVLVVWVIGCTIVAWIAQTQGRSPVTWFSVALLLSPVLGFVAVRGYFLEQRRAVHVDRVERARQRLRRAGLA